MYSKIVGSFLYYGRAVDNTTLNPLNVIGSEQAKTKQLTEQKANQLLDYMDTHPSETVRFYASDMILNVLSDASYLIASRGRNRAAGHYFLGSLPQKGRPIKLNGLIHVLVTILKRVAASAAE